MLKQPKGNARRSKGKKHISTAVPQPISAEQRSTNTSSESTSVSAAPSAPASATTSARESPMTSPKEHVKVLPDVDDDGRHSELPTLSPRQSPQAPPIELPRVESEYGDDLIDFEMEDRHFSTASGIGEVGATDTQGTLESRPYSRATDLPVAPFPCHDEPLLPAWPAPVPGPSKKKTKKAKKGALLDNEVLSPLPPTSVTEQPTIPVADDVLLQTAQFVQSEGPDPASASAPANLSDVLPSPTPVPASLRLWGGGGDVDVEVLGISGDKEKGSRDNSLSRLSPSQVNPESSPNTDSLSSSKQRTIRGRNHSHGHPSSYNPPSHGFSGKYKAAPSPAVVSNTTADTGGRLPEEDHVDGSYGGEYGRGYGYGFGDEVRGERRGGRGVSHPGQGEYMVRGTEAAGGSGRGSHVGDHGYAGYDRDRQSYDETRVTPAPSHLRTTSLGGYSAVGYTGEGVSPIVSPGGRVGGGVGIGGGAGGGRRGGGGAGEIMMGATKSFGGILAGMGALGGISATRGGGGSGDGFGGGGMGFDQVLWARWDRLPDDRLLLLLGYVRGMQIWDCSDLGTVREVFNTASNDVSRMGGSGDGRVEDWGRITYAAVLPSPSSSGRNSEGRRDICDGERPVIGLITTIQDEPTFIVYSLYRHRIVQKLVFPGLVHFQANERFIVISTVNPPTLHILSAASFQTLSIISSSSLVPFATRSSIQPSPPSLYPSNATATTNSTIPKNPIYRNANTNINAQATSLGSVLLAQFSDDQSTDIGFPRPVYALSNHRLLAFCSPAPPPQRAVESTQALTSRTSRARSPTGASSRRNTGSSASTSPANATALSQASELGQAALIKVGGSVLSGMRTLGGMAYSAAKAKAEERLGISPPPPATSTIVEERGGLSSTVGNFASRFFSRSAPAASGGGAGDDSAAAAARGRRYSTTSSTSAGSEGVEGSVRDSTVAPMTRSGPSEKGYYVTIVDLKPLLSSSSSHPSATGTPTEPPIISEFLALRHQPIAALRFSSDGSSILVSPRDGQTLQVFKIRPKSLAMRTLSGKIARAARTAPDAAPGPDSRSSSSPPQRRNRPTTTSLQMTAASPSSSRPSSSASGASAGWAVMQDPPLHVYDLKRGRTSAVVEEIEWADDERWIAIGTRKRTVHLFAVNPYGGKPDLKSHMQGVVRNVDELQPLSTEVHPLIRLRAQKQPDPDQYQAPLTFTFFKSTPSTVPNHLLPAPISSPRHSHHVGSLGSTVDTESVSSRQTERSNNFQDILVFDPIDGVLSLRRVTLELKAIDEGVGIRGLPASVPVLGPTSISLPKMGAAGRLSVSPGNGVGGPSNTISNTRPTWGRAQASSAADQSPELTARERIAATWNLRRLPERPEIRKSLVGLNAPIQRKLVVPSNWLAQAELSTYSQSTQILPRSIYLLHQFTFRTLGEDYHALIRSYRFDVGGSKIEVRREVEASALTAGTGESFVEGFSHHRDARRPSSSFDEPLASALGAGLDPTRAPPILPMLPNGTPGSGPKSIRNAIPIRSISDNMTESIGRIRNQFHHRVRSPRMRATDGTASGSGSTPLEFDEEDEDSLSRDDEGLLDKGIIIRGVSRRTDSGTNLTTRPVHGGQLDEDADADDLWRTWESQDRLAIEEAERFDDISVVGLLDEEQASMDQKMKARGRRH